MGKTYVCAVFKPINEARLVVPYHVAVVGHGPVCCPLVHDQLHRLDPAVEMGMEIPRNRGIRNLIMLLLNLIFAVSDENGMLKGALMRKEPPDEAVPVL